MAQGIIGKIWNIKAGSKGRSSSAQIGDSISYIINSEKCDMKLQQDPFSQIVNELTYITNDVKTLQGLYVGGRHITDVQNAMNEMMQVKEYFGKTDGRIALHGIISLSEEESDPKNAGKLMCLLDDLMQEIFPENQVVYAVHTNTENLHIHFIANTVGLDGRKIHMDKTFMRQSFEPVLNKLAKKYEFTPNEAWTKGNERDLVSIVERKMQLRKMIDRGIEESEDFESFLLNLRNEGVTAYVGKHLSIQVMGMPRRMRTYQLGSAYTIESIMGRIASKRDPFIEAKLQKHVENINEQEMVWYLPANMKKYKDMSPVEKKESIHILKLGRNPWREVNNRNWQLRRISDDLDREAHIYEIIKSYAGASGNPTDAKKKIIKRQKLVSEERAAVRANMKKYKPITDIYKEMQKYEIRSFLFEKGGYQKYRNDYEAYKELSERLMNHFGKSVEEVARFSVEQNNQLLYLKAQSDELSGQYRAILKYENRMLSRAPGKKAFQTFYEAVGHSEARNAARDYGTLATRVAYIVAEGISDIKVRVFTMPAVIDGKATVTTEISIMSGEGDILEEFNSEDMSIKEFNQKIYDTKSAYELDKCIAFEEEEQVDIYMSRQKKKENRKVK